MLKKIDRNCFLCYKKSFLSYSIFNLRLPNNSSVAIPSRGELCHYSTLSISVSSVFHNFFRIFLEFFQILSDPLHSLGEVTLSLRQLEHYNILSISVSSVFHNFFRIFWNFFRSFRIPAFPRRCYPLAQTARLFYHTSMGMSTVFRNFFVFFWDFFDFFLRLQPLVVCSLFRHNRCPFFPVSFLSPPIFFPFFGRAGLPVCSVFPLCVFFRLLSRFFRPAPSACLFRPAASAFPVLWHTSSALSVRVLCRGTASVSIILYI